MFWVLLVNELECEPAHMHRERLQTTIAFIKILFLTGSYSCEVQKLTMGKVFHDQMRFLEIDIDNEISR